MFIYVQQTEAQTTPLKEAKKKEEHSRNNSIRNSQHLGNPTTQKQRNPTGSTDLVQKIKRVRTKKNIGDAASVRAAYSGNVRAIDLAKARAKKSKKSTSSYMGAERYVDIKKARTDKDGRQEKYSGNISVKQVRKSNKKDNKVAERAASYTGTVRFVNLRKARQQKARKMASFKGPNPIRVRKKPKGAIISKYKGAPNKNRKPAIYNRKSLKKGRRVKKSDMPNYMKDRPAKWHYDSRETKMWKEGGKAGLPGQGKRELPKNNRKKNKKNKQTEEETIDE